MGGVGIWKGSLGCEFLRESMCAEGMGCGRRWAKWVLRGTVRVQFLNLNSLSCRIDKTDMIMAYKILHGFLEDV